jgi:predicted HicB family RNase H-like nuclease
MGMKPRQKYVPLYTQVRPEQKEFAARYAAENGIAINQFVRDAIQHAIDCPFFNGRSSTTGNVPPTKGTST